MARGLISDAPKAIEDFKCDPTQSEYHVEENDPLSAMVELRRTQTLSWDAWQIRVETQLRLSSTGNAFLLRGGRAWEGANEVCRRDWDCSIPRDFM